MARKRVLVVTTASVEPDRLRGEVLRHVRDENAEVKVVAPASDVSRLQWLANDEDEAREEAAQQAHEAAEAVEPAASVETEVGDSDPVQAVEDALRTFPADQIVIVTGNGDEAGWLEQDSASAISERFGLPVTKLSV
jgi:nucleotide-binding universal stress UspA family protein